ncbi:MAG: DUF1080 domain-containing protein [Planctomycetota bacterium]|nr:DUF1080 domain-containing protein [Planctomycetota bacterium]
MRLAMLAGCLFALMVTTQAGWSQKPAPVELFNGQNLANWYPYLKGKGKGVDPRQVFSVKEGLLRISGEEWGALTTEKEYENYRLTMEYGWGGKVWPPREKSARDSGLVLHCTGKDGAHGDSWMLGLQVNMIEGGTGDLSILGKSPDHTFQSTCEERPASGKKGWYHKTGAPSRAFGPGDRLLWGDKDPAWTNTLGFMGAKDIEKPAGQFNTLVAECGKDNLTVTLNGKLMTRATGLKVARGKIQFQSEGAELLIRRMTLEPLK